jgi:hypothetical protein
MLQHTWYQKLRRLNSRLRVSQYDCSTHLPGIYYVHERDGIVDVCATDIGFVPPVAKYENNQLVKSGYRRAVNILLHLKLTTHDKVRKEFPGFFEARYPSSSLVQIKSAHHSWSEMMKEERKRLSIIGEVNQVDVGDPVINKMKEMEIDNFNRKKDSALSGEQFLELASDIKEKMPDHTKDVLEQNKFNYEKAIGSRKIVA